jgi:hypothetical protein
MRLYGMSFANSTQPTAYLDGSMFSGKRPFSLCSCEIYAAGNPVGLDVPLALTAGAYWSPSRQPDAHQMNVSFRQLQT